MSLLILFLSLGLLPSALCLERIAASHPVIELGENNFTSSIGSLTSDRFCLVEFYASWCPHCKHFAPIYEKLATFLDSKQLGLYIARVDCATEEKLCGGFALKGYPSLYLGRAADFVGRRPAQLRGFEGQHDLAALLPWVGAFLNTTLKYSEAEAASSSSSAAANGTAAAGPVPRRPLPSGPEWSVGDVEGATLQLWGIMGGTPLLHSGAAKRGALREVLGGWAEAHPSASCKAASSRLLSSFDSLWPPAEEVAPPALLAARPCGPPAGLAWRGAWGTCAGSRPDTRGYSCGLWELIHTMALRLPDRSAAPAMLSFLTAFTHHFFACEPCVRHFSRLLQQAAQAGLTDRRSLALWLWRAHNEVNERLRGIETRYGHSTSGDPAFPKELWPPPERCPECRRGGGGGAGLAVAAGGGEAGGGAEVVMWDEEAVWGYLQRTYGRGSAPGADGAAAAVGGGRAMEAPYRLSLPGGHTASPHATLLPALGLLAAAALLYTLVRTRMRGGGGGAGPGSALWGLWRWTGLWRRRRAHGPSHGGHGLGGLGAGGAGLGGPGSGPGPGAK